MKCIFTKYKYTESEHMTHVSCTECASAVLYVYYPEGSSTNKTIELLNYTLPSFCQFNILIAEGAKLFPNVLRGVTVCIYNLMEEE